MIRRTLSTFVLMVLVIGWLPQICFAAVFTHGTGTWPQDWPKKLEPLRSSARTIDVATGIQELIHEIRFDDRETFERIWPVILKLKTPGAPLTIYRASSKEHPEWGKFLNNKLPAVRIYAPTGGYSIDPKVDPELSRTNFADVLKQGRALKAAPPWPDDLKSEKGELPEYVHMVVEEGKLKWIPADLSGKKIGFFNRARVDLELVVDGKVVDLNRIVLPRETPLIDKRF